MIGHQMRAACFYLAKRQMVHLAKERAARFGATEFQRREDLQLPRLNSVWLDAWRHVPYYTALKQQHDLPGLFGSIEDFTARVPILQKHTLQKNPGLFLRTKAMPDGWVKTGGSTGEPVSVGVWKREGVMVGANHLIARSWYGVVPGDRLFLVWGHAHLLGSGWGYLANRLARSIRDRLLSYYRANAYLLDDASLERMAQAYLRYRPDYVIGYAGALGLLARHVQNRATFRPKVVIGCAEGYQHDQARERVSSAFGAPVAMEYASAECGCIAHEHPEGRYRVFWDTHLLEMESNPSSTADLLVTKLTRCYTPLIRYRIGDEVSVQGCRPGSLTRFKTVLGRTDDHIELPGGGKIHPGFLWGAIGDLTAVLQIQVVMKKGVPELLRVRTEGELNTATEKAIRGRLARVSGALAALPILRVDDMPKTPAGKVRWYVNE